MHVLVHCTDAHVGAFMYVCVCVCVQVGSDVSVKYLSRSNDPETPTLWFAQDSKGAIWKVDIDPSYTVSSLLVIHLNKQSLSFVSTILH